LERTGGPGWPGPSGQGAREGDASRGGRMRETCARQGPRTVTDLGDGAAGRSGRWRRAPWQESPPPSVAGKVVLLNRLRRAPGFSIPRTGRVHAGQLRNLTQSHGDDNEHRWDRLRPCANADSGIPQAGRGLSRLGRQQALQRGAVPSGEAAVTAAFVACSESPDEHEPDAPPGRRDAPREC